MNNTTNVSKVDRAPEVPQTALVPPVAAGAFYCVLDLLVVSVTARMNYAPASPGLKPSVASVQAATSSADWSSR